jgi:hypothetical protein
MCNFKPKTDVKEGQLRKNKTRLSGWMKNYAIDNVANVEQYLNGKNKNYSSSWDMSKAEGGRCAKYQLSRRLKVKVKKLSNQINKNIKNLKFTKQIFPACNSEFL